MSSSSPFTVTREVAIDIFKAVSRPAGFVAVVLGYFKQVVEVLLFALMVCGVYLDEIPFNDPRQYGGAFGAGLFYHFLANGADPFLTVFARVFDQALAFLGIEGKHFKIFNRSMLVETPCVINEVAMAFAWVGSKGPSSHLDVKSCRLGGSSDDYDLNVGQIYPFGSQVAVAQHGDLTVFLLLEHPLALF